MLFIFDLDTFYGPFVDALEWYALPEVRTDTHEDAIVFDFVVLRDIGIRERYRIARVTALDVDMEFGFFAHFLDPFVAVTGRPSTVTFFLSTGGRSMEPPLWSSALAHHHKALPTSAK